MKKKIFALVLVVMLCISVATSFAEVVYNRGPDSRTKVYTNAVITSTLSTSITSSNRILGFSYTDSAAGVGALFDVASVALCHAGATAYLIAEIYVAAGTIETLMFPLPVDIDNGLVTKNSNSTGAITVYYE